MMRFFKIAGITLLSLLLVVCLAAGVLVYVVFTPEQLTPVVNRVADEYIDADYHIGRVELTFFSTFPEFGLRAGDIYVVNPTEGAPSDTLLSAGKVVARLDVMALLRDGNLLVRELTLQDVALQAYIAPDGTNNFSVLTLPEDTTVEEDTTSGSFIRSLTLDELKVGLTATSFRLLDERDSLDASLHDAVLLLTPKTLQLEFPELTAVYCGVPYATSADVRLSLPYELTLDPDSLFCPRAVAFRDAELKLNRFAMQFSGNVALEDTMLVKAHLKTDGYWRLSRVLDLVPEALFTMPDGIHADASFSLEADVDGQYAEGVLPLVDATLLLKDGEALYDSFPEYPLKDIVGELCAHVDMNNVSLSHAEVKRLSLTTGHSMLSATGDVADVLGDPLLDLALKGKLLLSDFASFIPEAYPVKGEVNDLSVQLRYRLSDLTDLRLEKGSMKGSLKMSQLTMNADSMRADLRRPSLSFVIPAGKTERKHTSWMRASLAADSIYFDMTDGPRAELGKTDVSLTSSNLLLSDGSIFSVDLDVDSKRMQAAMTLVDSLGRKQPVDARLLKPSVCAFVELDPKDTTGIPTLSCTFSMQELTARYDTITLSAKSPKGKAGVRSGHRDKTEPSLTASLSLGSLRAKMGSQMNATVGKLDMSASATHRKGKNNVLLEWNPRLKLNVDNASASIEGFAEPIRIPDIALSYSNRDFRIDTSRIEWGRSDFSLVGEVKNIGPWLEHKGLVTGKLRFISHHADINELMAFTSGIGADGSEEVPESAQEVSKGEMNPYMVPKGMDVTLETYIADADAFGQHLTNLGGQVYIRNGILIIEEMGFICEAARMSLTAMYKTPRKNHLYAGLDYHMTDVKLAELVDMIPQVDTLLPMLRSFRGRGEFHLAAETYLNGYYEMKPSTTRGAASLAGENLTLLDGETFTKIAKILTFKKSTENKIDSISVEAALYKKELDIYPFLISMDRWRAAVGGQQNLDGNCNYHVSLLSPLMIGVDVDGSISDLHIKPSKCRYKQDFSPVRTLKVESQSQDIRKLIREALSQKL